MFLLVLKTFILFCTFNRFEYVGGFDIHRYNERLVYSNDVNIEDFPYYASLLNCGAAILSEDWVITAAHCVQQSVPFLNFVWVGGASFEASKMVTYDRIVFPDNGRLIDPNIRVPANDVALIHLSKPLQFTDTIQPLNLPLFEDLTGEDTLMVAGRGLNEMGKTINNLQKIDVRRLSAEECLSDLPYCIRELHPLKSLLENVIICAERLDSRPGLCNGDSGSPLVRGNTLVGIASFIQGSCIGTTRGFYVNIANYLPWIKSVTGLV